MASRKQSKPRDAAGAPQLYATEAFSAHVDGEAVEMGAGEAFAGSARAASRLESMGLLGPKAKEAPGEGAAEEKENEK